MENGSFNAYVKQYLGKPSPHPIADQMLLADMADKPRETLVRALSLMKRSGYSVEQFTPLLLNWLVTTIPGILPDAWGGRIPPVTFPNRHKRLDDFVAALFENEVNESRVYVDVGCGFPPVTSADTAGRFQKWRIVGVDKSFADYVLYDSDGNYACFDKQGCFLYFQGFLNEKGRALYADPEAARRYFNKLFSSLSPRLGNSGGSKSETVESEGCRLIHHHIKDFETNNLSFLKSDVLSSALPPARVVRCMNLLLYFEPDVRRCMLADLYQLLDDGGCLIIGTNGLGAQARYAVFRKSGEEPVAEQFAFSLDNLGHIVFMPWLTFVENEPEVGFLAELSRVVRDDHDFWPDFSHRLDALLEDHGICRRQANGFLHLMAMKMPTDEFIKKNSVLWSRLASDGYTDLAIRALRRAGYDARKNEIGDIAVKPRRGLFS